MNTSGTVPGGQEKQETRGSRGKENLSIIHQKSRGTRCSAVDPEIFAFRVRTARRETHNPPSDIFPNNPCRKFRPETPGAVSRKKLIPTPGAPRSSSSSPDSANGLAIDPRRLNPPADRRNPNGRGGFLKHSVAGANKNARAANCPPPIESLIKARGTGIPRVPSF